jgi:hypothetical protein
LTICTGGPGEIEADGKGHEHGRLPLPSDVGDALVAYLTLRGRREGRRVFLTVHAPTRPIQPSGAGEGEHLRDLLGPGVRWLTEPSPCRPAGGARRMAPARRAAGDA